MNNEQKGIVIKSTGSWYTVRSNNNDIIDCKLKGNFRVKGIRSTTPVVVGDIVEYDAVDRHRGLIYKIKDRKNFIFRKSTKLSKKIHILAANIDQVLLIYTFKEPKTDLTFIDRFLINSQAYKIPVVLIFNKTDIYDESEMQYVDAVKYIYDKIGYKCIKTSCENNENLDELKNTFKDKISIVAGNSGVGKSTLINTIEPILDIKIGEISEYHKKGKHTTTHTEMYDFSFGGSIIDTPGIKGFGLIDINKEELMHFFPEMLKLTHECQYYNCTHTHEPNCAVKKGLETGEISISRYISYTSILEGSDEDKYRENIYKK